MRAAGEDLVAGLGDFDLVRGRGRVDGLRQLPRLVSRLKLLAHRILGLGEATDAEVEPAQPAAEPPEEDGGPALRAVGVPDVVGGIGGDGEAEPEPPDRRRERLRRARQIGARRVHADGRQPGLRITLRPGVDVRQALDPAQLTGLEEDDEQRPSRGQPLRRRRLVADPGHARGERRQRDIGAVRAQARGS